MNFLEPTTSLRILSLLFLSILFLQSGLDKVFNFKGNLDWLTEYFAKSPLKNMVGLLMPMITLMEVAAGVCSAIGLVMLLASGSTQIGLIGAQLSALCIVSLFFGQRMAQDYASAATLAGYFLVCLAAIYVLG